MDARALGTVTTPDDAYRYDFVRVVPGSRDMAPGVGGSSLQALAKEVLPELRD